ncbi:MAG: hypothetical protein OHK006_12980 [Thermodesulfovibrionales bacterium]
MKKPIDKIQIKLVHIAKAQIGLSDEDYRTLLSDRYWVNSCKALSYDEATDLIDHMKTLGFKLKARKDSGQAGMTKRKLPPSITQLPSPEILHKIDLLKADIKWIVKPNGYERWLKKFMGVERPATMKQAVKIVEGLKGMRARQQRAAASANQAPGMMRHDGHFAGGKYVW